jgi:hypothetical protein
LRREKMDDLSWILADGESLDDALEDFAEDVANPERVKRRHDAIREQAHVFTAEESKKITEALCAWIDEEGEEI